MFTNMDTDKSGTITYEELKTGLARLGSKLSESEVQQLMEAVSIYLLLNCCHCSICLQLIIACILHSNGVLGIICNTFQADVDGNGTIDYIEFISATMQRFRLERDENLYKAFQYFDKDNSG